MILIKIKIPYAYFYRQSANKSDGILLKLDFRSLRSIEFTQETVHVRVCPASIPKTLTIIQIVPINLLRPRAISPPDFRCKSALVCPLDDVYFRTIRPIKIIHHFQRAQMHEASVYVFTYESTRENYYGKHMWNIALWQSRNLKEQTKRENT